MTLTTQQIEVLARFDGWEKKQHPSFKTWGYWKNGYRVYEKHMTIKLTEAETLISMRLKIGKIGQVSKNAALWSKYFRLGELILNKEYTAAAINISEIIQKLEA
jgi:hypothetical protein